MLTENKYIGMGKQCCANNCTFVVNYFTSKVKSFTFVPNNTSHATHKNSALREVFDFYSLNLKFIAL